MKILIIEDERSLSDSIVAYLSSEKYLCEQAFTYNDAKMKVNMYEYDCVLLLLTRKQRWKKRRLSLAN